MSTYIPDEVREQLNAARLAGLKKTSRLKVMVGDDCHTVLRMWHDGFSVEQDTAPALRGLVDLYDGDRHLYQCLIIATEAEGGEQRYEFKRSTVAADRAPLDHYREQDAPLGLLPRG